MRIPIAILILMLVVTSCDQKSTGLNSPYPGIYPGPGGLVPVRSSPVILSTPDSTRGTIIGRVVNSATGQPSAGLILYLGTLLPLNPGPSHLVNFDLTNSPKVYPDDAGEFRVENINPGEYTLILWTPHAISQAQYPDKPEKELIIVVEAGRIVDIGTVAVVTP